MIINKNNRKRIAIICSKGFGADGISAFVMNNYRRFDHNKFHCALIYPRIIGDNQIISAFKQEFVSNQDITLQISKTNLLNFFHELKHFLTEGQYDIAHIHGSSCGIALEMCICRAAGIKHILPHSHNTMGNHPMIHKILKPIVNTLAETRLGCGSEACQWMFGNKKATIVPNGIVTSDFYFCDCIREKMRLSLGINNDEIVIGHVGGFNKQKNHSFLLMAFADILRSNPNIKIRLLLIGQGYLRSDCESLANRLGIRDKIVFLGQRTDVTQLMQAMDMFFLPSLYEGFPIVTIEAQASGLPTVMSATITHEVGITDLTVWLPIDKGTECWVDTFNKLRTSKYNRITYAGKVKAKGYDIETSSEMLQRIYLNC